MFQNLLNSIRTGINASILTLIIPLVFFVILFIDSKACKTKEFNEDYLDKNQTKIIKGFLAIGIVLHHLSQRTAAPWLKSKYIIHGLDFFVNIGYLFVGGFLFITGYGLYKSFKSKSNYFENYFIRRILPILLAYLTTNLSYYFYNPIKSTYNWYIVACLLCYILFYFGFSKFKKEYLSFLFIIVGVVAYSVVCAFLMLGGWWYNTISLFVVGLLYAKYERNIVSILKKLYIPLLILLVVTTCLCNWYGRYYEELLYPLTSESIYDLYSTYIILFRSVAAISFVFVIILVSLKFKFNNKVLAFYGSISLEFYLIQGLFVQGFSYSYFDESVKAVMYYIRNIPLYMLVVIALSTGLGFGLHFCDEKIKDFLLYFAEKRKEEIAYVKKALKKVIIVICLALVAYVFVHTIIGLIQSRGINKSLEIYENNYISYADVDGKKMAAYIVGEGENTLVFMRGNDDPCPSLSLRYLADKLAEDYKVVVLDYLGTGFSDRPDSERTSENITNEIHEALNDFGIKGKYILVPQYISSIYAQEYTSKYKDEVKGIIAFESETEAEQSAIFEYLKASPVEYHKYIKIEYFKNYCLSRLCKIKGVSYLIWKIAEPEYIHSVKEDELIVASDIFFKNIYNSTYLNERYNEYENIKNAKDLKYPDDIFVYDVIAYYDSHEISRMGLKPEELHGSVCSDLSKHSVKIVNDMHNVFFAGPTFTKSIIDEAVLLIEQ